MPGTANINESADTAVSSGNITIPGSAHLVETKDSIIATGKSTIIVAKIDEAGFLSIQTFNDGVVNIVGYIEKNIPAISKACRRILATSGIAGRNYPLYIVAGNTIVFIIPTLYFGSRITMMEDYSDIEIIRGISFTGQFI